MPTEDETQQSRHARSLGLMQPRAWMRWIKRSPRNAGAKTHNGDPTQGQFNVHATLLALPTLLDGSNLPNGVIELLINDFQAPTRQLLDIHDGRITLVEPGQCVPWASVAGSPTAWAKALGPDRDVAELQLTGDERLAQRFLAALPTS